MGAWIEIASIVGALLTGMGVAPYMGAWIEINKGGGKMTYAEVAPYMGAWIEIANGSLRRCRLPGRSLHGSVD